MTPGDDDKNDNIVPMGQSGGGRSNYDARPEDPLDPDDDPLVRHIRSIVAQEAAVPPPPAPAPIAAPARPAQSGPLVLGSMSRVDNTDSFAGSPGSNTGALNREIETAIATAVRSAVSDMMGPDLDARIRRIARAELVGILTEFGDR